MKRLALSLLAALGLVILSMTETGCSVSGGKLTYEDSIANIAAQRLLQQGDFALVAERISIGRGGVRSVTPNTNFIIVTGSEATVQASPAITGGPNGVGGITFSGSISNYRVETNKKGQTTAKFHIQSRIGSAEVTIVLEKGYNGATGYVSGDFNGRDIVFYGSVQASTLSRFIGRER